MALEGWRPIQEAVVIVVLGFVIGGIAAMILYYFVT